MKRILSIFLCVAMLMSAAVMAVSADPIVDFPKAADVTSVNKMSFKTDKATYAPGEEVIITASMDSIWGDPNIVGDINGYEGTELPGAYGMACLISTLIFPLDTFTPLAGKDLIDSSSILNIEYASVTKTSLSDAKKGGFYNFQIQTPGFPFNEDEDAYIFLNGSGDLFNFRLTVNEDAKPGTYKLPVGPYVITDLETGADDGFPPEFEFFNQWYAWIGNSDSLLYDREVDYGAGASSYEDGRTDYLDNIAYIEVTIVEGEGGGSTPIVPDEPIAIELDTDTGKSYLAGETVTVNVNVKNSDGIDAATLASDITYDPDALKLVSVTSPIADIALEEGTDFTSANAPADSKDTIGTLSTQALFFEGAGSSAEDGTVLTLTFEVTATAAGASTAVTYAARELEAEAVSVNVALAANHTHAFEDKIVPATCIAAGYTDTVCSCGFTFRIADVAATGHTPSTNPADVITVPATCTNRGYTNTNCSVCGKAANTVYTEALGHDLETVKSEVSCTADGYEMQKCKREGCKYESDKTNIVAKYEHKNPDGSEAWVVEEREYSMNGEVQKYPEGVYVRPTTSAVGYMGKTCTICKTDWLYEEIPMVEIKYGDINMDGKINLNDVRVFVQYLAWNDLRDKMYFSTENADTTHDGRVNAIDASKILQYLADWPVDLDNANSQIK